MEQNTSTSGKSKPTLTENQINIRYLELADELEYHPNTIAWVHYAVQVLCKRKKEQPESNTQPTITARELCTALIKDANRLYTEPLKETMHRLKLFSSKDIGKIVYGLIDKELLATDANESINDYDDIFTADNIGAFLSKANIYEQRFDFYGWYRKVMWTLYIIGTAIIVGSYVKLVSNEIGWIGWSIAMCGFLMQFLRPRTKKRF